MSYRVVSIDIVVLKIVQPVSLSHTYFEASLSDWYIPLMDIRCDLAEWNFPPKYKLVIFQYLLFSSLPF